jgi:CRISPR-associated protein Cmr4
METKAFLLHAMSPLHAGTGQAMDLIDLPIARYQATGIPFVPGASVKGVLRDARNSDLDKETLRAVFGPDDDPSAHAGALIVSDARLLALPVRSFRGTFAWVTSPLLLALAKRDLAGAGDLPTPCIQSSPVCLVGCDNINGNYKRIVYLEEIDLETKECPETVKPWVELISPVFGSDRDLFGKRFIIVDDETMTFLWETATQVDQRVRIDSNTRTVAESALWLEESLPPETLLIGLLAADRSRRSSRPLDPHKVLKAALPGEEVLQFGGKATVGRGRCRIVVLPVDGKSGPAKGR